MKWRHKPPSQPILLIWISLFLLLLCDAAFPAQKMHLADEPNASVSVTPESLPYPDGYIGKKVDYYIDTEGDQTIESILELPDSAFTRGTTDILNFGFIQVTAHTSLT